MIVVPRDEENRYRLYAVRFVGSGRQGATMRLLATGPTGESIGLALVMLAGEGEIEQEDRVGVLDTHASEDDQGTWIANPFA